MRLKHFLLLTCSCVLFGGCFSSQTQTTNFTINMTTEKGIWHLNKPILLKIAYTMAAQRQGFMGCSKIPEDYGILFMYHEERVLSFWMANCLVDIDILFLNNYGEIVKTYTMSKESLRTEEETEDDYYERLLRYSSIKPARYAIELRAGKIKELGIKIGDKINFITE